MAEQADAELDPVWRLVPAAMLILVHVTVLQLCCLSIASAQEVCRSALSMSERGQLCIGADKFDVCIPSTPLNNWSNVPCSNFGGHAHEAARVMAADNAPVSTSSESLRCSSACSSSVNAADGEAPCIPGEDPWFWSSSKSHIEEFPK